jgi:hypothetical protein
MPWEIVRLTNLTRDNRPIDIYTKSGGFGGYSVNMIVIPDYNVGAAVLVAGEQPYDAVLALLDLVTAAMVSSLDSLARDQAQSLYAGDYVGEEAHNATTKPESRLSLAVDNGPGLKITAWSNAGKSILDILASMEGTTTSRLDARLYPIGDGDRWRLSLETLSSGPADPSRFSHSCTKWLGVDGMRYAKLPVDEFRFHIQDGVVKSVENLGLRAKLWNHKG